MHILNIDTRSEEAATGRHTYLSNDWRGHGQLVANLARDVAQEMGMSDGSAARVERAARYHDIGKSRLPDLFPGQEVQADSLSRCERELLMSHTWLGYRILQSGPNADTWVAEAALLHHEWWNGKGYPLGLARSDIPLVARIVAVADAYSTLAEQRPYNDARHVERVLREFRNDAGTQFDPECVEALVSIVGQGANLMPATDPPAGSIVN